MPVQLTTAQKAELRKDLSLFEAAGGDAVDLLEDLQNQLDALPIDATVLEGAIADGAVSLAKLKDEVADLIVVPAWGTPDAEAGNAIEVLLQLQDAQGNNLDEQHVVEIHVSDTVYAGDSATATISDAAVPIGTILSGDDTAAVQVQTDASGQIKLEVTETAASSRFLSVRPCYGSAMFDCRDTVELPFA